jgi:hypothetical protein
VGEQADAGEDFGVVVPARAGAGRGAQLAGGVREDPRAEP